MRIKERSLFIYLFILVHESTESEGLKLFSISLSKCPGFAFVLLILFLLRKNDLEFDNLFTE